MITSFGQRFQKITLLVILTINPVFFNLIYAQDSHKLFFITEFSSKFSVGKEVRRTIQYEPGFTLNYPTSSTYMNPIYCLEFGPNYHVTQNFDIGVSAGIGVAQNVSNPLTSNGYFNRVMFPLTVNLGYHSNLGNEFSLIPRCKIGYQFSLAQFGNTEEGFLYEQSGGLGLAIDVGVTRKIGKYSPAVSIGYELNKIHNDVSLGWVDGYDYDDKYQFSTSYHFIKLGFEMKY